MLKIIVKYLEAIFIKIVQKQTILNNLNKLFC
jgi:hypothetical protein